MPKSAASLYRHQIEPHLKVLFRAAYRLTTNAADAEDLVQDTCLKALTKIQSLVESRSALSWLLRVQYNLFVDGTRLAERNRVRALEPKEIADLATDEDLNPEVNAERAQREDEFLAAWAKLNGEQRALIALRAEGFSLPEIEEITGLAVGVLGARLHRARQSLGRHLRTSADVPIAITQKESQQ
jgi:RNA polymerase sigma-70 factor (ECF subfamily)